MLTRQCTECFILRIAQTRPCFNCFKECLVKAYPFRSITRPTTSSFQVRRLWRISYANASVGSLAYFGLINLDMPSCFIVYNMFFTPHCAILQYSTPDAFPVLYGKYSSDFPFDPLMQSPLKTYIQSLLSPLLYTAHDTLPHLL